MPLGDEKRAHRDTLEPGLAKVGDDVVDAPAGTFVYVRDPSVTRGATALEAGTTLIAVGGEPGKAFEVSAWEREYAADA